MAVGGGTPHHQGGGTPHHLEVVARRTRPKEEVVGHSLIQAEGGQPTNLTAHSNYHSRGNTHEKFYRSRG